MNLRTFLVGATAALALTSAGCKRRERALPPQTAAPVPGDAGTVPGGMPPGGGMPAPAMPSGNINAPREIASLEQIVAQDPKNVRAWIQLGNDYFDTQQRQKAIDAYARALELEPRNADVLTDQGVMYRETGAYQKAVENFQQANEIDPLHMQSLFNLGVVYAYDLKQPDKAIATWNQIIAKSPQSPHAAQARQAIEALRRNAGTPAR